MPASCGAEGERLGMIQVVNQTLAMISLWVATAYLLKEGKYRFGSLITALPGAFMSAVSLTYILMADEGFRISAMIAYPVGIAFAMVLFLIYCTRGKQVMHSVVKGEKDEV